MYNVPPFHHFTCQSEFITNTTFTGKGNDVAVANPLHVCNHREGKTYIDVDIIGNKLILINFHRVLT